MQGAQIQSRVPELDPTFYKKRWKILGATTKTWHKQKQILNLKSKVFFFFFFKEPFRNVEFQAPPQTLIKICIRGKKSILESALEHLHPQKSYTFIARLHKEAARACMDNNQHESNSYQPSLTRGQV